MVFDGASQHPVSYIACEFPERQPAKFCSRGTIIPCLSACFGEAELRKA